MDSLKSEGMPEPDTDDEAVHIIPLDQDEQARRRQVTRRQRASILRIALVVAVVLFVVVMLASNTLSIGALTKNTLTRLFPPPTPTLAPLPETNLFYLDTNVPNEQITLDGHLLRSVSRPGIDPPLKLTPGRHVISWAAYPFNAQSCTISAPYVFGDTCGYTTYDLAVPHSNLTAHVLMLNESLTTLPGNLQQSLATTIQATINGIHDSVRIEPGDLYYADPQGETTARQPLIATLRFNYAMQSNLVSPLTIDGVACQQLCIVPWRFPTASPVPLPQEPGTWLTLVLADMSWDYTMLNGHAVALSQPLDAGQAGDGAHPILMRTTWTGNTWQVTPLIGARQVPPLLIYSQGSEPGQEPPTVSSSDAVSLDDDPACVAAEDMFLNGEDTIDNELVRFISGPHVSDGCLIAYPILTHSPIAYFLEHFGILFAVNDAARIADFGLPVVDVHELALAHQLLASQSSQYGP